MQSLLTFKTFSGKVSTILSFATATALSHSLKCSGGIVGGHLRYVRCQVWAPVLIMRSITSLLRCAHFHTGCRRGFPSVRAINLRDKRFPTSNTFLQSSRTTSAVDKAVFDDFLSSPSQALISALEDTGYKDSIPNKHKNKVDYSRVSPRFRKASWPSLQQARRSPRKRKYRLQMVLAQYLRVLNVKGNMGELLAEPSEGRNENLQADLDQGILHVFTEEVIHFLKLKGYDAGDVVTWARILTSKSSDEAASLLMAYSSQTDHSRSSRRVVPVFVFLFLLRRKQISSNALQLFIIHAWNRLQNQDVPHSISIVRRVPEVRLEALTTFDQKFQDLVPTQASLYPPMSEPTIIVMIIRLLRYARKLWPEALQSISAMLTAHVTGCNPGRTAPDGAKIDEKTSARLSFVYNRILYLLAIPSTQNPYRSIPYHQRAQFNIIRKMNEFEPALTINREGYRAVIKVQLAHRKTVQEREWAQMKAKSWPPWKEEKVAIDAEKGVELGISRANESLRRLQESGYAVQEWEVAAKILTGWDTDQSPTIQTRAIFHSSRSLRRIRRSGQQDKGSSSLHGDIWAARIQSTRTLDEAWACFLAYKDFKATPSLSIYVAMLEKIVFDTKRRRKERAMAASDNLASSASSSATESSGDGKEVSPPPMDPRDRIYIRSPLPNIDAFFDTMIADGIRPSAHCLQLLLNHAGSLADGLKYSQSSTLSKETIQILFGLQKPDDYEIERELVSLPDYLFASYIRLLCRFAISRNSSYGNIFSTHLLPHAYQLSRICKRAYRPAWYQLLYVLTRPNVGLKEGAIGIRVDLQDITAWQSMLGILDQMKELDLELDFQGFHMLCLGFTKAAIASQKILAEMRRPISSKGGNTGSWRIIDSAELQAWEQNCSDAEDVIYNGTGMLKTLFKRFVSGQSDDEHTRDDEIAHMLSMTVSSTMKPERCLPRLLAVPAPAELHSFIRALGLNKEYNSILELVHWMVLYAPELKAVANELKNGSLLTRRCLIAIRAFLEGRRCAHGIADDLEESTEVDCATDHIIQEAFAAIDGVEEWGGLPSIEEVEMYCQSGNHRAIPPPEIEDASVDTDGLSHNSHIIA